MKYIPSFILGFIGFASTFQACGQVNFHADCNHAAKTISNWQTPLVQTTTGDAYDLIYQRCYWTVNPAVRAIQGEVTTHFKPLNAPLQTFDIELSSNLVVDSVKYRNRQRCTISHLNNVLNVSLPTNVGRGQIDSLTIYYRGTPPNTGLGSFTQQTHGGAPVLYTLSCPYGGRDWWPSKLSLNDKIDSIDIYIKTPTGNKAASNGLLMSTKTEGNNLVYYWKHRYPITNYLVCFSVTNYVEYSESARLSNGRTLPILNYVYPESEATARAQTPALPPILVFYDSLLGTYPYPLEKYGHAQFGWGGGMEHQTMSFVVNYSRDLLAHELAHQWFGNKVTCGDFRDVWLSEGFATYLTGLSKERFFPSEWPTWKTSNRSTVTSGTSGSVWVDDITNPGRIYSSRLSYSKGAMVLHTLRFIVGDQAFFQGLRNYLADPRLAYGYATTPDLQRHLEATSGKNLTSFFQKWFNGQGHPVYDILWEQDPQTKTVTLKINQTTTHNSVSFFELPVQLKFTDATGLDTVATFSNTYSGQSFSFATNRLFTRAEFDPNVWLIAQLGRLALNAEYLPVDKPKLVLVPNPVGKHLYLRLKNIESQKIEIKVYNIAGQLVHAEESFYKNDFQQVMLPNSLSAGQYKLTVRFGKNQMQDSFILE